MSESKLKPSEASQFWSKNLDPQNLERGGKTRPSISIEDEIAFADTPDVRFAKSWLLNSPLLTSPSASPSLPSTPQATSLQPQAFVIDLGAGLGAVSFVFARAGARVIAVDSSLERLRELCRRAKEAGCEDKIFPVVAAAESLPFKDGSIPALYTKSVLIHTDLPKATSEIRRILADHGRAALIEPQPGNPFAWFYRKTLAPKEWQSITHYFDAKTHQFCIDQIGEGSTRHFYLFSFLAFAFQFGWANSGLFRLFLKLILPIDRLLFRILPVTRAMAWFGVNAIEKMAPRPER